MKIDVLAQRKFYAMIGATILGVVVFYFAKDATFTEWSFYELGVLGMYMGGNVWAKYAEKNK